MSIRSLSRLPYQWVLNHISIRLRLALWYGGLLAITLTLFSVIVYAVAWNQLEGSIDQTLHSRAVAIANTVQNEVSASATATTTPRTPTPKSTATPVPTATAGATPGTTPNPTATSQPTPVPTPDPAQSAKIQNQLDLKSPAVLGQIDLAFEIMDANRTARYLAPNIARTGLPVNGDAVATALSGRCPPAYTTRSQQGSLLRMYIYPITLPSNNPSASKANVSTTSLDCSFATGTKVVGVVAVAKPLDDVNSSLDTLQRLLITGVVLAVLFTSLGGWFIAGTSLDPIARVTRTARAIAINAHGAGLGRRVDYTGPRDEVGELASTFDDMLAAVERVANAQRRFVADASHELRAPLTTIKGSLEFLRRARDLPEEERAAVLDDAYTEAGRMTALVNDLLLLARADATASGEASVPGTKLDDQLRGRRELVELDQLALDIFRHARAQVQARHKGQLQFAIEGLEPVAVQADPGQLRQVMLILLDNAIKYTPPGGKVRISVTRQGSRAAISIADNGIGIAPEVRPHIFERFYRGDQARERDEHGSGLGLAIANWIVEAHGGEISVHSQAGKGSTFTVLLPAVRRPDEQVSQKLPAVPASTPASRYARAVVAGAISPLTRLAANVSRPREGKVAAGGSGKGNDGGRRSRRTPRPRRARLDGAQETAPTKAVKGDTREIPPKRLTEDKPAGAKPATAAQDGSRDGAGARETATQEPRSARIQRQRVSSRPRSER
ncbi:MAG TPA: HAMP domain-containing sensor histidine kinase [Ktedonobacterales bacterium]